MKMKQSARIWPLLMATAAFGGALLLPTDTEAVEQSRNTVPAMDSTVRTDLERRVDEIANRVANAKSYFENDQLPIHIRSTFDPVAQSLVMAIDERFGPMSGLSEMEQLQSDITYAIWPLLENIEGFWGLDWRYGGKDMYFWFPGDRRAPETPREPMRGGGSKTDSVLINAGHGYYFHHGYKDWRFQRAPANGIVEDEITGGLAMPVYGMLSIDGTTVKLAREATSFGDHIPSGKPLYLMAARYLLEIALPDRPDIWHSLPDNTTDLRDYMEDIRSRPLYANSLGVSAMLSLHTNAADDVGAHGTTVIVQPGRPESAALGAMALCYIAEQLHAKDEYADFTVARTPLLADKGENRLANMPSIIVELGFHTNASDAAALQDPVFMGAAATGLAKGYRLYREGKKCEEFALEVPVSASGPVGDVAKMPVQWVGNPVFPISVSANDKECASTSRCGGDFEVVPEEDDSHRVDLAYRCTSDDAKRSPFAVVVSAHDRDGIKVKPQEISVSCEDVPERH